MTATPTARRARPGAPDLELVSIDWRRVQVRLAVRAVEGELDPHLLRLRRDGSGASVPMTGWHADGDVTVLRVNVMQGPGRRPLQPGRWQLVTVDPGTGKGRPVRLRGPAIAEGVTAAASFPVWRVGVYGVTASVERQTGAILLDVRLDASTGEGDGGEETVAPLIRRGLLARVVTQVKVVLFQALFALFRVVARRNGRRILFSSDSRADLGGNLKLVHDRMVERGMDRDFELLTLFKPGVATRRSAGDRFRLPWLLARADVVVIDDFQPAIYRVRDPDVTIVQLWHAVGAFKTVGYSRVGKAGAPDPFGPMHKNYTWVTVSSTDDIPVYAEAFGIPESHVVATGIPRVDPMFDPAHRDEALAAVRSAFPATVGRETILFAPTFRGDGARSASYDLSTIDYDRLHELCVERDAVCLIRMHPFVTEPLRIPEALRDRILDASASATTVETNDLLFAVDLLITDYSSIVYEYSTLGRPMLFYAWDLDEYVASRDFYEPYRDFVPGRIVRTFAELLDAIRREDFELEKVDRFARRHFDHLDRGSTDRVIDLITAT
jgi:CDP-ribitol ribitolphosphotransferase